MKALLLFALPLLAQQTATHTNREAALGAHLAAETLARGKPIDIPAVTAYIDRMAQRLAASAGEPLSLRVQIVDTADFSEPAPLPGGYIMIPARLFETAAAEAEFAVALAHAAAHVILRHGFLGGPRPPGQPIPFVFAGGFHAQPSGNLIPLGFRELQQKWESETEAFAPSLLQKAQLTPTGEWERMRSLVLDVIGRTTPRPPPSLKRQAR